MISKVDPEFWRLFNQLPKEIQIAARKSFEKFLLNPDHPSLNFKSLKGDSDFFSARINLKYRVVGQRSGNIIVWFWIGS
ncbi:MAG: type II toxin-antitoxin system RelE family toxin, partial [Limisphaerales bacterium]